MSDTTTVVDEAQDQADFGAGFEGKTAEKIQAKEKPETARETPRAEEEQQPEFIQVTKKDWDEVQAAARRTASYDQQFSKAFGTIGNLQKLVNGLNKPGETAPPPPKARAEVLKEAFAEMEKDFPELAQQNRAALERVLSGTPTEIDSTKIKSMMETYTSEREAEALEDAFPEWRDIVGAVDITKEQPNPENAFRKWLATKDAAYQTRINGTISARVIERAIRAFQNETKAPPKPAVKPRDDARAERIRGAVQPRGDGAGTPAGKSDDDEFIAGFNSR